MTADESAIRDALASHAESYGVERELQARNPHAVYEVRVDGRRAVCKVARSDDAHIGRHALVARCVRERTVTPTPRVLGFGDGYALLSWTDGEAYDGDSPRDLRERRLRNAGSTLATLHEDTDFPANGYLRARDAELKLDAEGDWSDMFERIVAGWAADLTGTRFESAGNAVLEFVRDHGNAFDIADAPDLVHGDYQPGNVRFEGDRVVAVLDWEFSLAGAGEFDLCRAEREFFDWHDASEGNAPDAEELREALREGYESVRTLPAGFVGRREAYRAALKLDPMRFFDGWKGEVDCPDEMAESMCQFVRESIADAHDVLSDGGGER